MAGGRVDFSAKGASDLAALAKALKAAGNGGLRKELYAGLQRGTGTMRDRAKANALADLPKGGGRGKVNVTAKGKRSIKTKGFARSESGTRTRVESLAQRVAGAKFTVKSRMTGTGAGVTIKAEPTKGRAADLGQIDKGINRHPRFGNRAKWYPQKVTGGWFSRAADEHGAEAQKNLLQVIDDMTKKLAAS